MDQLQDMWYTIRDSFTELWNNLQDQFPFLSNIRFNGIYVASGAAILASLIGVLWTLNSSKTLTSIELQANYYKEGQQQLNQVLGDSQTIAMTDEDEEIIGRAGLMLQYKDLSALPSDSGIKTMKKNLGLADDAVEDENENYNDSMSDKIRAFAGNYGGALVVPGTYGTNSLKIAVYKSTSDMTTHDGESVSNVLYEKISRTIKNNDYGVSDTKNTLIFLSAANINGLTNVKEGSELYTLFGNSDSSGRKETNKYICTGTETGSIATADDETDEGTDTYSETDAVNPYDVDTPSENYTSYDHDADEYEEVADEALAESTDYVRVLATDMGHVTITEDDIVDDSTSYNSDGTINEEWSEENTDKTTVSSGSTQDGDGSENGDNSDKDASGLSGSSSSGYVDDGLPTTSKDDVNAITILDAKGNPLTDNKTADLILYQYSKSTGEVKITYWNLSGSEAANAAENNTNTSTNTSTTAEE